MSGRSTYRQELRVTIREVTLRRWCLIGSHRLKAPTVMLEIDRAHWNTSRPDHGFQTSLGMVLII